MSNWISSASTLLNENISDVTFFPSLVGRGEEKTREISLFYDGLRCIFWCRKKGMQKLFTANETMWRERGWKRWKIARYTLWCFVNIFNSRDKLVLMFHSGLLTFVNQLVVFWKNNSSLRLMKLSSPLVIY